MAYIEYFTAIQNAFTETDTDKLVERWAEVDRKWMAITGPFQPSHPLEAYEDIYRNAVALQWSMRLESKQLFSSHVKANIVSMFENIATKKGLTKDHPVSITSIENLARSYLYVTAPATYYGADMTGLPAAQVVPNDTVVKKSHGIKIFSFLKHVHEMYKAGRLTLAKQLVTEASLLQEREAILHAEDPTAFYEINDVMTHGHEFGHTLWLDNDTEITMNKSGNFQNVEEWKATAGGFVAFFLNPDPKIQRELIVIHVSRIIRTIDWMKVDAAVPYYVE